jgi:hypothetical protein
MSLRSNCNYAKMDSEDEYDPETEYTEYEKFSPTPFEIILGDLGPVTLNVERYYHPNRLELRDNHGNKFMRPKKHISKLPEDCFDTKFWCISDDYFFHRREEYPDAFYARQKICSWAYINGILVVKVGSDVHNCLAMAERPDSGIGRNLFKRLSEDDLSDEFVIYERYYPFTFDETLAHMKRNLSGIYDKRLEVFCVDEASLV